LLHRFTMDGVRVVLDVGSGAVHVMDEPAWVVTGLMDQGLTLWEAAERAVADGLRRDAVREAGEEIAALIREGFLFAPDPCGPAYTLPAKPLRALCLHLAHDCNLRCAYCFAGQGPYRGSRSLMPPDVGRRALDYLLAHSGSYNRVEVDFFGGEPLMNFPVLRELVRYGREREGRTGKRIDFTVTTNGVLLSDEVGAFLNQEGLQVILSLDGRPAVHDAMRRTPRGGGSYDLVAPRITRFVHGRNNWNCYVRGTYTRHNTDFAADFLHLAGLGFRAISLEPVVAAKDQPYALAEEDFPVLAREYERLAGYVAENPGVHFFHFDLHLDEGPCLAKRLSGCGAGHEYLAVDPSGDLYPCHQFVGRADFRMGNIRAGVLRQDLVDLFRGSHVLAKEDCRNCWARFFCSGGCHAAALDATGDMSQPGRLYCLLVRKRVECALFLAARQACRDEAAAG